MVSLAAHILESKATKFDPGKFQDEYEKALRKLVQRKAKGHTIEAPEPEERPRTSWTRCARVCGPIQDVGTGQSRAAPHACLERDAARGLSGGFA
jgi:hypothetical protein